MEKTLKVGWHVGLALAALIEMTQSQTAFRRALCGGCFGWHVGAAYDDLKTPAKPKLEVMGFTQGRHP